MNIKILINKFWRTINKKSKLKLVILFAASIIGSFVELIGISSMLPLIIGLTQENDSNRIPIPFIGDFIKINNHSELLLYFFTINIIAGIYKGALFTANTKLSFKIGTEISSTLLKKILAQNYQSHIMKGTSGYISTLIIKINSLIYGLLYPCVLISCNMVFGLIIIGGLLTVNSKLTLLTTVTFGLIFLITSKIVDRKLREASNNISKANDIQVATLQKTFQGIKEVILYNKQDYHVNRFTKIDEDLRNAQITGSLYSNLPKYCIETIGIVFLALTATYLNESGVSENGVAQIGLIAMAAIKILPLMQQTFWAISQIKINKLNLIELSEIIDLPSPIPTSESKKIGALKNIHLTVNDFFHKGNQTPTLKKVDLCINTGEKIAIVGPSGAGKSTLTDILMGLIYDGSIVFKIDDFILNEKYLSHWRNNISHVSQNVFLFEDTLVNNITLGDEFDLDKFNDCCDKAGIYEFIDKNSILKVQIAENGNDYSGGQKQRIGIARSLYKNSRFLFLDEPTSALDSFAKNLLVNNIIINKKTDLTLVVVTHDMSILKYMDRVIEIKDGYSNEVTSYEL